MLPDLTPDARALLAKVLADFAPPPRMRVSEWAESRRVLTRSFSAEPGRWRNSRTPWVVAALDCLNDAETETVVITGGSQVAKSETALNLVGYIAEIEPANVLYVVPDDGLAIEFSRRLDDMIDASEPLKARFASRRQRGAFFNVTTKSYLGGTLSIVGAGSPSALSARPCRIVIADELDRVRVIRGEGDAVSLARARQATFYNRKTVLVSTPTTVAGSRIEAAYAETDRNHWHARCPDCGGLHVLDWSHVEWKPGSPEEAVYIAPCCGGVWHDAKRWAAGAAGEWRAAGGGRAGWRGFRYPGLASPWIKLAMLAAEFEAAKTPALKQPFWNLRLGLPFDAATGEGIDAATVRELAETYAASPLPERAALVVAGVDVQASWLALHVVAFGDGDEAWSIEWHEIPGDPLDPKTWAALEAALGKTYRHPSGAEMEIEAVAIDSGFQSQQVYEFSVKARAKGKRWFATKGMSGAGRPLWQRGGSVAASLSKIFLIGADGGKSQVMGSLVQVEDGAGRWHTRSDFPAHFWDWLVAEEAVTTDGPAGPKVEWRLKRGQRRNEALDTAVLALAARYSFDPDIPARLERLAASGSIRAPRPCLKDLATRAAALSTPTIGAR